MATYISGTNTEVNYPPSNECLFCNRVIDDIGGKRITAQQLRGTRLSSTHTGGGNIKYPSYSVKLSSAPDVYMNYWGEKGKWIPSAVESAKSSYLNNKTPWFCQICGERKCHKCGFPVNYPAGSDVLYEDGQIAHVGMLGVNAGCSNSICNSYKEFPPVRR